MIAESRSEFVGRGSELAMVATLLDESRLLTLTGVGGVGKTRLAVRAVNQLVARSGVSCWFVALDSVQDPRRVPLAVVRAFPFGEHSAGDPLRFLADVLGDETAIVVLDNCEHLIDGVASFVDELLDTVPHLRIVATSRRPLDLDGEQVFAVPPLSLAGADGQSDALSLLVTRARSADFTFELAPGDVPAAQELCRSLDGLPLAIELAATRLRSLSLTDLTGRLSSRFTLLRSGSRSAAVRQRTLRAVVDWSYELCSPAQQSLWAALSVFGGPFDLEAAAAVADVEVSEVVGELDDLVAQSVIEADRETGRFRMLETIRSYGRERAEESGIWPQLLRRHLAHYRARADDDDRDWYGPRQREIVERQRADRAELQIALATATAQDADSALGLFAALRYHWGAGGFLPEGRAWGARVLALPGGDPTVRVRASITAAWLCLLQGDLDEALILLDEAHSLSSSVSASDAEVFGVELHRWRGTHALFSGEPATAAIEFEQSIVFAMRLDRPEEALLAQFQLTTARSHLGRSDAAIPAEAASRFAVSIGESWMRSLALWSLALAEFTAGALADAEQQARTALTTDNGIDDPVGDCLMLELLSWVDAARSPSERSAVLLGAARGRWRRIGSDITVHGPQMAAHHDRCVERVRRALGARSFERLTAEGERLTPQEAASIGAPARGRTSPLSDREWEVAVGIREGMSNREIAARLVLSVRTVDTHVQRILAKLGFSSRSQIAAWYESSV